MRIVLGLNHCGCGVAFQISGTFCCLGSTCDSRSTPVDNVYKQSDFRDLASVDKMTPGGHQWFSTDVRCASIFFLGMVFSNGAAV